MVLRRLVLVMTLMGVVGRLALGGAHSWRINEIFSNPSGSVQFIELTEYLGGNGETGIGGFSITSNANSQPIGSNVAPPTGFRSVLFGTAAFAALPGAPPPDHLIPAGFFSTNGDNVSYGPFHTLSFGAGVLPTDGILSLAHDLTTATNSPTNYAGQTGSVNAAPAPPGVPDGQGGTSPLMAVDLGGPGNAIRLAWDVVTCAGSFETQILYGQATDFPATSGGTLSLLGSVCTIGNPPHVWGPTPLANDGSGLIWYVLARRDGGGREGSWGAASGGVERVGPGPGGSSGACAVTGRDLSTACGH